MVQRIARGDDHLRALVREGDPRLELAAQVKESHAAFRGGARRCEAWEYHQMGPGPASDCAELGTACWRGCI